VEIGKRLRELRGKPPKLSQAEAAAIAGVSARTWYDYERGESSPGIEALERYAINRNVSLYYLLSGEEASPHGEPLEVDIPVLDHIPAGPITMGFGEYGILGYIRSEVRDPKAFALIVSGFSMSPEIQEGDVVIVSPLEPFVNGKIYATVTTKGEHSLKRVRRDEKAKAYALLPTNKEFPTLYIPENEILRLVRVVEVRRNLQ